MIVSLLIWCLFTLPTANYQENLNLIITVNDEVDIAISGLTIQYSKGGNIMEISTSNYVPGNLSILDEQFSNIGKQEELIMRFSMDLTVKNKLKSYYYQIPVSKSCLVGDFLIIHIYNTDVGKYKNVFKPFREGENYTFDFHSPDCTISRVTYSKPKCKN